MEPYLFNMLVSEMVIQYSYIMISYIVNLPQFVILGICIMIGRKHPAGLAKPAIVAEADCHCGGLGNQS